LLERKGMRISYTYCPHCLAKVRAELRRNHAEPRLTLKHAAP